jgi:hypothetical protein
MQAITIPRFLLPQLTWSPHVLRPVGISGALQRCRHQSTAPRARFIAHRTSRKTLSAPFQNVMGRQWQKIPSQFSIGLSASRAFSVTAVQGRDHHFDTLKFVQKLKGEGFTEEQSEAMMRVLSDVIEERCVPRRHPFTLSMYTTFGEIDSNAGSLCSIPTLFYACWANVCL